MLVSSIRAVGLLGKTVKSRLSRSDSNAAETSSTGALVRLQTNPAAFTDEGCYDATELMLRHTCQPHTADYLRVWR